MRRLAILLICYGATPVWADLPLLYEGFDYSPGQFLASSDSPEGLLNPYTGNHWYMAGTMTSVPVVIEGNQYLASTGLPEPSMNSNSISLTSAGASGASNRIAIPDLPAGDKTVYWSGFLNVVNVNDLGSAPGLGMNEAGAVIAGFNNNAGAQTTNITVFGGVLALKRASVDPESPLFNSYYLGTATNSQSGDCAGNGSYRCANRHFADYSEEHFQNFPADRPTVYSTDPTQGEGLWGPRPHFPAVPLAQGETVFVVGSYEVIDGAKNDVARLWINPDPSSFGSATPPEPNVMATTAPDASPPYCNTALNPSCTPSAFAANDISNVVSFFFRNNGGTGIHNPTDARFDELRVGLTWGSITAPSEPPPGVPGDYNGNGTVDAADYVLWRKGGPLLNEVHDPGSVTPEDYDEWRARFGNTAGSPGRGSALSAVPEPSSLLVAMLAAALCISTFGRIWGR